MKTSFLLTMIALILLPDGVAAGRTLSLAKQKDDHLYKLVETLSPFVEEYETPPPEGAVVLKQDLYLDMKLDKNLICENHVLYVFNPDAEGVTEQSVRISWDRELESYGAWIHRADGTLERMEKEQIQVLDPGDGQAQEVLFPFPAVREGDILSWSVESKGKGVLYSHQYLLSNPFPTEYSIVHLITDGFVAYRMQAWNIREEDFSSEVKEEKQGAPSQMKFSFADIPAFSDEDYALPVLRREPYVDIAYRGFYSLDFHQWIYTMSWAQLAYGIDDLLQELLAPTRKLAEAARPVVEGATDTDHRADSLYRFTRDSFESIPLYESSVFLSAEDCLQAGYLDDMDRAALLTALINATGGSARLGFARSSFLGHFDAEHPSLTQFDTAVVESPVGSGRWFDPACRVCPAGELPPELHGANVFLPRTQLDGAGEALWQRVVAQVGGDPNILMRKFYEQMSREPWYEIKTLSSSRGMMVGATTEDTKHDPETGASTMHVESAGNTNLAWMSRSNQEADELGEAYLQTRYDGALVSQASMISDPAELETNHVAMDLEFASENAITMTDELCILPPELVFGREILPGWRGPDRDAFHTSTSQVEQFRWSMPLPEGWVGLSEALYFERNFGPVTYSARISVADGILIVLRTLKVEATTISGDNLTGLDETIQAIRDFESRSITLEKNPEARVGSSG